MFSPRKFSAGGRFQWIVPVWVLLVMFLAATRSSSKAQYTEYSETYAVQVSAEVQEAPPGITLSWPPDTRYTVNGYTVYRKAVAGTTWNQVATLPATTLTYHDANVEVGGKYEYQIYKAGLREAYGYVTVGIRAPLVENHGKVILLVDETHATALAWELSRYEQDLVGDGWTVIRRDISRTLPPPQVKALIKTEYEADPGEVKAVFLFGHVPILKSGNLNVDGHFSRPMPADVYYGDMNGNWGDADPNAWQLSQNYLPSDVELQVGRVDFWNMGWFAEVNPLLTEQELLRQYLNKEHNFRHKLFNCERRGLIADEFGERDGYAFAASAWRGFSALFGANHVFRAGQTYITNNLYFPTMTADSYLWSYGCGGGQYTSCNGVGDSADFARNDIQGVFTMFLGSYFGEWDAPNSFLRAPLGSASYALTSAWSGYPHWFVHHMGQGTTIGYSTRLTQNNATLYRNYRNNFTRGIHIALMGDPTLRMHVVAPVTALDASASGGDVTLTWEPSNDTHIQGYHVYRSADAKGPYTRLTGNLLTETSFTDAGPVSGIYTYMVRAVKLEGAGSGAFDRSGSGTYFNPSVGKFIAVNTTGAPIPPTVTVRAIKADAAEEGADPGMFSISRTGSKSEALSIQYATSGSATPRSDYESLSGSVLIASGADSANIVVTPMDDQQVEPAETVVVTLTEDAGYSIGSPGSATVTLADNDEMQPVAAAATFVKSDISTQGNWKGIHGADGYGIIGDGTSYPAFATIGLAGKQDHVWVGSTQDGRCLQKVSGTDRVAAVWYSSTEFTLELDLTDGKAHRVGFYFMDWDRLGRTQTIEVLDAETNAVLDTQEVRAFGEGIYLIWDLQGHTRFRIINTGSPNAIVNGLFFDPAPAPLEVWSSFWFSEAERQVDEISGKEADPEGDGLSNLLEYALGLNPRETDRAGLPGSGTVDLNGADYLTITFRKVTKATDITCTAEVCGDLGTWNPAVQFSEVDNSDGTTTIKCRDVLPMTEDRRFIRLKVSHP